MAAAGAAASQTKTTQMTVAITVKKESFFFDSLIGIP